MKDKRASRQAGSKAECCRRVTLGSLRLAEATYVNEFMVVSLLEVMQDRSIIKVCQVGHILAFFILWGVDLIHLFLLEVLILMGKRTTYTIRKILRIEMKSVTFEDTYINQFAVITLS